MGRAVAESELLLSFHVVGDELGEVEEGLVLAGIGVVRGGEGVG